HAPTPGPSQAPAVVFDASAMGSPLPLDKDWRVGISADPAAASPNFDDSAWAVRGAESSMEEVPDEDPQQQQQQKTGGIHVQVGTTGDPEAFSGHHGQRYAWFRLH